MTVEWSDVKRIFTAAAEIPSAERPEFLDRQCGGDAELRARVESLLAADEVSDDVLPPPEESAEPVVSGRQIGKYRLRELIGEGGMGVVYLAEQDHPRRDVALKIIKGTISPSLRLRFHREARLLGRLRHPGIAQIYDGGTEPSEHGEGDIPYFAMEYVVGVPITEYARDRALPLTERMRLLHRVAGAVAHAHENGVIHRDLKPANILVCEDGSPHILDFGIARAAEDDEAIYTRPGQVLGTPPYMSPEQCDGDVTAIDVRTDVYSLGAVAYEVLSDQAPFRSSGSFSELVTEIRRHEPARLGSIDRRLQGDIEAILGKAMEKNPERRYASASELADDIQRFLDHEPVRAAPPSRMYRARKWIRRYPTITASALTVFVILSVSLTVITRLYFDAEQARIQSERDADSANRTFGYFADMLASIQPRNYRRGVPFETVLDDTTQRVSERFDGMPGLEGRVRGLIGSIYLGLGRYEDAERHILASTKSVEKAARGDEYDRDLLAARIRLAELYRVRGERTQAELLLRDVLEKHRRSLGVDHEETLRTQATLAVLLQESSHPDGMAALRDALDVQIRVLGRDHVDTARTMRRLGWYLHHAHGASDEGEPLLLEAFETLTKRLGERHPDTMRALESLTYLRAESGRAAEAVDTIEQVHRAKEKRFGKDHPTTLQTALNRGFVMVEAGQREGGIALIRGTLHDYRRALGTVHQDQLLFGLRQFDEILEGVERTEMNAEWAPLLDEKVWNGSTLRPVACLPVARVSFDAGDGGDDRYGSDLDCDETRAIVSRRLGALIYRRVGDVWKHEATLEFPDSTPGRLTSVAIDGATALVVRRIEEDAPNLTAPVTRVYVFDRTDKGWQRTQEIEGHPAGSGGVKDVAIEDDYAALGVPGGGADGGGVALVYRRGADGVFVADATLAPDEAGFSAEFGRALDISGGVIVVASPGSEHQGRAFVFQRIDGEWKADGVLAPNREHEVASTVGIRFGWAVSTDGSSVLVGASYDDTGPEDGGSATVFVRGDAGWREESRLVPSDAARGDLFGSTVRIVGDVAIVTANRDDHVGLDSGSAYVFRREAGGWRETVKLLPDPPDWNLGLSAVDSDGRRVLLGASLAYDERGSARTGTVYSFVIE